MSGSMVISIISLITTSLAISVIIAIVIINVVVIKPQGHKSQSLFAQPLHAGRLPDDSTQSLQYRLAEGRLDSP